MRIEGDAFMVDEVSSVFSLSDGSADGDIGVSIDTESIKIAGGSLVQTNVQAGGRAGDARLW